MSKRILSIFSYRTKAIKPNTDKIKVLHLIESLSIGGAEKRLLFDLQNLNIKNFSHTVCHLFEGREFKEEIEKLGVAVYGLDLKRLGEFNKAFFGFN